MTMLTISDINDLFDKEVAEYKKRREERLNSSEFAEAELRFRFLFKENNLPVDEEFIKLLVCEKLGIDYDSCHYQHAYDKLLDAYPRWIVTAWLEGRLHDPLIQRRWTDLR